MNLAVLEMSRRAPQVGDVFVLRPPDGQYLFGRVIDTDADPLGVGAGLLIYVYRARSGQKTPIPALERRALLVPPMITNRQPWTRGYFEFVENSALKPDDRLPKHCFWDDVRGVYRDERGNRLAAPVEPVGVWGLHSFRTIDDEISKALAIPLAPEE